MVASFLAWRPFAWEREGPGNERYLQRSSHWGMYLQHDQVAHSMGRRAHDGHGNRL